MEFTNSFWPLFGHLIAFVLLYARLLFCLLNCLAHFFFVCFSINHFVLPILLTQISNVVYGCWGDLLF